MLVHSELHGNHIANVNENGCLIDEYRREGRHEGQLFQVTWQAFGNKNALGHKTLNFLHLP